MIIMEIKLKTIFSLSGALFLLLFSLVNAEETKSCVTEKCHANKKVFKFSHSPMPQCDSCHSLIDEKGHKFKLNAEGKDLCLMCHENKYATKEFIHGPIQGGDCTSCHDPHGSANPKLLKSLGNELCFTCHGEYKEEFLKAKSVHPVAKNNCLVCHDPHNSSYPKYLKSMKTRICPQCHFVTQKSMGKTLVFDAKLASGNCIDCHNPHSSEFKKILKKDQSIQCPALAQ